MPHYKPCLYDQSCLSCCQTTIQCYLTSTRAYFRTFAWLYNVAASPASRLRSAVSLAINDLPNCLDISCAKVFADDTNITIPGCTFAELEQATNSVNSELINLYSWLKANNLSLNIAKTEFMVISTRQKFLAGNCSEINIQLDSQTKLQGLAYQILRFDYWWPTFIVLS